MIVDAPKIWETCLGHLQLEVTRSSYDTWLQGTVGLTLEGDWLTVGAPTPFAAEWLERRMYQLIQRTATEVAIRPIQVRFEVVTSPTRTIVMDDWAPGQAVIKEPLLAASPSDQPLHSPLALPLVNPRYTFKNFVVGKFNQFAHAAASAIAHNNGRQYNPLFIYAGVGMGKTHLLHAIASAAAQRNLNTLYVTAEQFTNAFIRAIREHKTEDFRAKYRNADILLLDDVQFLVGKEQTQEGFFHTFNDLHNANRQIVVTSDRPPKTITLMEDRLRSRFEWGLITEILQPDLETRLAILYEKALAQSTPLPEEVALVIAQRATRSVRELEGCLNRVIAMSDFLNERISSDLADVALSDMRPPAPDTSVSPYQVLANIAERYSLSSEDLRSRRSDRKTTHAQRVAMFVLADALQLPLDKIASLLGNWHRKTIKNGLDQISTQITTDHSLQLEISGIVQALGLENN